jgi:hypothetical protein
MPFYKKDAGQLLVAPNFVLNAAYELREDSHDLYSYPVDGWYWFTDLDAAMSGLSTVDKPVSVTMRQCRLALLQAGLLDTVEASISELGAEAAIEWNFASVVTRDSPLLSSIATTAGLSEQAVDDLFAAAAGL